MDKKKVYCRYCGKLIDDNALFCEYCGKRQNADTIATRISRYKVIPSKFKSNRINWAKIKKGLKCVLVLAVVLIIVWLIILLGQRLYGLHLTSEWTKEDERREIIALKDITKADDIARDFFKEFAESTHFNWCCHARCSFDHVKRGILILRNAAEKGNADAQFTLGAIYKGARYDVEEPYFNDTYTMLGEKIDLKRAIYWYTLAAKQGHNTALNNLGQAYREGKGVKQDLVKATELIRTAAEQGNPLAQLSYGDMFRDGEVCIRVVTDSIKGEALIVKSKPNVRLAKEWWTKALNNGNERVKERAKKKLEQVYEYE